MIYVFSNVDYPPDRKIHPAEKDLLVFLNKAVTAKYYADHPHRMCIRRSPDPGYGVDVEGADNRFVFSGPVEKTIPKQIVSDLKRDYDWDYPIENGKTRCATTGYMAVKYLERFFPEEEIVLVNFGYDVKVSTYRCPWHNWVFEARELAKFKHIYTTDQRETVPDLRKRVCYRLSGYLGDNIYASAVLANLVLAGFAVNVQTQGHEELWRDCPLLDRSITEQNADAVIREHNLTAWEVGCPNIIEGVTAAAALDLGVKIPVVVRRPYIWCRPDPAGNGIEGKYIVFNAGWQGSAPTKRWARENWEKLVATGDALGVKFVQVGQRKNHSDPIPGAVDLIDRTPLPRLLRIIRDAACVIAPPTGIVHIAAAYRTPVILLAGGREPPTLAAYDGFTVLSACGREMDCCRTAGCHRNHFGGGEKECGFFSPDVQGEPVAACMTGITPEAVIDALRKVIAKQ